VTSPSGQNIANRIAAGDYDGELGAIFEALQLRFTDGAAAMRWVIDFDGLNVTEDDLTLDEAFKIEKVAGCNWGEIEPVRSAAHCRAILAVCMADRLNLSAEEVETRLKGVKVSELLKAIRRESVVPAPLDSAA
jgi:hypothetical protein